MRSSSVLFFTSSSLAISLALMWCRATGANANLNMQNEKLHTSRNNPGPPPTTENVGSHPPPLQLLSAANPSPPHAHPHPPSLTSPRAAEKAEEGVDDDRLKKPASVQHLHTTHHLQQQQQIIVDVETQVMPRKESDAVVAQLLPAPKPTNRCKMCNKRVGLIGFSCKCGGLYCGQHRYSDVHHCTFDYRTAERERLSKALPVVEADKLRERIGRRPSSFNRKR